MFIQSDEIDKTLQLFFPLNTIKEIRAFGVKLDEFSPPTGVFAVVNKHNVIKSLAMDWCANDAKGVYFTLNPVKPTAVNVKLNEEHRLTKGIATTDESIKERSWILVDIDPNREPKDTSSTDEEHTLAQVIAKRIALHLQNEGWPLPVIADSGNGAHLLYACDPTLEIGNYLSDALNALAYLFNADNAEIDVKVFNASRITRFYGTKARKGEDTNNRPHRYSRILEIPEDIEKVTLDQIKELAKQYPKEMFTESVPSNMAQERFAQLDLWIRRHKLSLRGPIPYQNTGRKWIFAVCPFNESHIDDSAYIAQFSNGAISAGCMHKSCADKKWKDLVELYGPLNDKTESKDRIQHNLGANLKEEVDEASLKYDFNTLPPLPMTVPAAPAAGPGQIALTDMGNARRFALLHAQTTRYVAAWGQWYAWNGSRWVCDTMCYVETKCKLTALAIRAEASQSSDQGLAEQTFKWAIKTQASGALRAMQQLAKSETAIAASPNIWDKDPLVVNLKNGMYHLGRKEFIEHDRNQLCTQIFPVDYVENIECPHWLQFLSMIMEGDNERVEYLQRVFGYCLTGLVNEEVIFFFIGTGANGKSTLLSTMQSIMGNYAKPGAPELLTVTKAGENKHPASVADLHKARLAVCQETDKGTYLSEGLVKSITSQDEIKARFMGKDWFQFTPTHKIIMAANHKPTVRGTDNGIWRRLHVIPFNVVIPKEEQDKDLKFKLLKEASGILNWAIEGYYKWKEMGLKAPKIVMDAVSDYRETMDLLSEFMQERCSLDKRFTATLADLYESYQSFCIEKGDKFVTRRAFSAMLLERGCGKGRNAAGILITGITLANISELPEEAAPL